MFQTRARGAGTFQTQAITWYVFNFVMWETALVPHSTVTARTLAAEPAYAPIGRV